MTDSCIFIDLDGTIVSYHDRFYKVYSEAYSEIGEIPLPKQEWLKQRRNGGIHYPPGIHEKISPIFERLFESREYLKYDTLIPGMNKVIHTLQKEYPIKIVSFRANNETLTEQLHNLGIHNFETIIQGYCPGTPRDEKANMIRKVIPNPSGWIIGDTFYEVLAGKKLGLKTISVTYGDQSKETLQEYNPDFIVDSPSQILDIVS